MTEKQFNEMREECIRQVMRAAEEFKAAVMSYEMTKPKRDERQLDEFRDILSTRTRSILYWRLDIETAADLLEYVEQNGARSLLRHRNFGQKSLGEIYNFVEQYEAGKI